MLIVQIYPKTFAIASELKLKEKIYITNNDVDNQCLHKRECVCVF